MNISQPAFRPVGGGTVNLAASAASSNVQIQSGQAARHVRIFNSGAVSAFIECGASGVAASVSTSMPIAPGTVEIISCPHPYVAAITASGTATLYFTPGEGL